MFMLLLDWKLSHVLPCRAVFSLPGGAGGGGNQSKITKITGKLWLLKLVISADSLKIRYVNLLLQENCLYFLQMIQFVTSDKS